MAEQDQPRRAVEMPPDAPDFEAPPDYAPPPDRPAPQGDAPPEWPPPAPSHHWDPPAPGTGSDLQPVIAEGWAPPAVDLPKAVERPHPLTGVAKSWIALFGLVFVFGRDLAENGVDSLREIGPFGWMIGLGILGVVVVNLVLGLIEWRTTTFVADDEEFRIERNFLSKESSRLSYAKIQSVDIERSLPARMLGLASVQIDVGGSGGQKLEFLGRERAEALRDHLLARMKAMVDVQPDAAKQKEPAPGVPNASAPIPAESEELVTVAPGTLLKGVLVSSFLPFLLLGLGFIVVMLFVVREFSFAAMFGVVFGVGGYLWRELVTNWDFTVNRVPDGLHVRRGLFTKVSRSLKADRIQAVAIRQDFMQRLTGLYRMRVTVLGTSILDSNAETTSTVLPYGTIDDVRAVLHAFWPGVDLDAVELHPQPPRARWLTPLGFRQHRWGANSQLVVTHHGWVDHTISVVPHRRMQSIGLLQGPLQRRLRLARVSIHTTDGPVSVEAYHLDEVEARRFVDEQVERARIARETPGAPAYLTAPIAEPASGPALHEWPPPR